MSKIIQVIPVNNEGLLLVLKEFKPNNEIPTISYKVGTAKFKLAPIEIVEGKVIISEDGMPKYAISEERIQNIIET